MIEAIIRWSVNNRFMVVLMSLILAVSGTYVMMNTPVDAIPDLSDVQVIIKTPFPGQAPQVVEDQVTYPLTTAMLSVPGATTVRGYSFFGDSYVYVIFEDGTDLYWARSRVLEYLNQVASRLPAGVTPALGPDATGVGWAFEYALVDESGNLDLQQLRSLQDWNLRFALESVPGVAEVNSWGGHEKQYHVIISPAALLKYNLTLGDVFEALVDALFECLGRLRRLVKPLLRRVDGAEDREDVLVGCEKRDCPAVNAVLDVVGLLELGDQRLADVVADL